MRGVFVFLTLFLHTQAVRDEASFHPQQMTREEWLDSQSKFLECKDAVTTDCYKSQYHERDWQHEGTFFTGPFSLKSGEVINKFNSPIEFPKQDMAMRHTYAEIVEITKGEVVGHDLVDPANSEIRPVPLSEVYNHHWFVVIEPHGEKDEEDYIDISASGGWCFGGAGFSAYWVSAAEQRGHEVYYPKGYAVMTSKEDEFSAGIHLIRTTNVHDVQKCTECICEDDGRHDPDNGSVFGSLFCCDDGYVCENSKKDAGIDDSIDYYVMYTMGWDDVEDQKEITVYYGDTVPNCGIEYHVHHDQVCDNTDATDGCGDEKLSDQKTTVTIPYDMEVLAMTHHLHEGGEKMYTELWRPSCKGKSDTDDTECGDLAASGACGENEKCEWVAEKMQMFCESPVVYGTGGKDDPGNELGYLVSMSPCYYDPPFHLKKNDELRVNAQYGKHKIPNGHWWHGGVMGLFWIHAYNFGAPQQCKAKFEELCSDVLDWDKISQHASDPAGSKPARQECYACSLDNLATIHADIGAHCTDAYFTHLCKAEGDKIPYQLEGKMDMSIKPIGRQQGQSYGGKEYGSKSHTKELISFEGPKDKWFGIAFNNRRVMETSQAVVWSKTDASGEMRLSMRKLGGHAKGELLMDDVGKDDGFEWLDSYSVVEGEEKTSISMVVDKEKLHDAFMGDFSFGSNRMCVNMAHGVDENFGRHGTDDMGSTCVIAPSILYEECGWGGSGCSFDEAGVCGHPDDKSCERNKCTEEDFFANDGSGCSDPGAKTAHTCEANGATWTHGCQSFYGPLMDTDYQKGICTCSANLDKLGIRDCLLEGIVVAGFELSSLRMVVGLLDRFGGGVCDEGKYVNKTDPDDKITKADFDALSPADKEKYDLIETATAATTASSMSDTTEASTAATAVLSGVTLATAAVALMI